MRRSLALIRMRALSAASYRVQLLLSVGGLLIGIIPLYFIADALQPMMAESIQAEGGHYFAFILVGMVSVYFLATAVSTLPGEFGTEIRTGTLEAILSTPTRMSEVLVGMLGWGLIWTAIRGVIVLIAGWFLGAQIAWLHLPAALLVVFLLVLAYIPIGMISSALILSFRTAGPLAGGVLSISTLLGGTYYPTHVIPSWLQDISSFVPLTYGLRAMRQILLDGASLGQVLPDLSILALFVVVLLGCGTIALTLALRYARRTGTLAQY